MGGPSQSLVDRVSLALELSPHIGCRHLRVETDQGHVRLCGVVNSYYQKQMAQEALRRVDGVETIENHLEVAWSVSEPPGGGGLETTRPV